MTLITKNKFIEKKKLLEIKKHVYDNQEIIKTFCWYLILVLPSARSTLSYKADVKVRTEA